MNNGAAVGTAGTKLFLHPKSIDTLATPIGSGCSPKTGKDYSTAASLRAVLQKAKTPGGTNHSCRNAGPTMNPQPRWLWGWGFWKMMAF